MIGLRPAHGSALGAVVVGAAIALLSIVHAAPALAQSSPPARILVMPFENVTREGRLFWLTEAAAVLLTDDLNALGASAITRTERQQAFERLQVPPAAVLTDATVIRIGQLVGASQVVVGSLQMENDAVVVRARSIALESGRVPVDVTERDPLPELFATFERIARRMAPASPRSSADVEKQHPPVAVFEAFIKGLLAETPATAISYLRAALAGQPSFDRARLALWDVYNDQGDHALALAAVVSVADDSPWARRARFLAGLSQLNLKKFDDAFATFKALADAQPSPAALNNLGVVQLRRGAAPPGGQPAYFFNKAADADPDEEDFLFNLGYAYWLDRDPQAAIYWLREAVRRNPADADAHFVLAAALGSSSNAGEATRERELARRLSAAYEPGKRPGSSDAVPKGLERIKHEVELPHARQLGARLASSEQRSNDELARFYLERGQRLFQQENDRDAIVELNHAIYLSPYLPEAHLLLGRALLRTGRIHEAIDAFKIVLWNGETAEAHAALGEAYRQAKDIAAARTEAERALALDPASTDAQQLLARLEGR
ncbi:MAG: putative system TPR-repeat lipoprotein [Acidobacteria bacterium]|nr:putative system TPR-repeat lipoprotein [Acidobacteriota bacterium]